MAGQVNGALDKKVLERFMALDITASKKVWYSLFFTDILIDQISFE